MIQRNQFRSMRTALPRRVVPIRVIRGTHRPRVVGVVFAALKKARNSVDHGVLVNAIDHRLPALIGSCLIPSVAAMKEKLVSAFAKTAAPIFITAANSEAKKIHYRRALRTAAFGLGTELIFDHNSPEAIAWAKDVSSAMIVDITENTRNAIQAVMERAFLEHLPPAQAARLIEPLIGLDTPRAMAVMNLRDEILANPGNLVYAGELPIRVPTEGFGTGALQAKLDAYASRLLKQRAVTIARTETARASAAGQHAMWRKALAEGYLDNEHDKRRWIAGPDACEELCAQMHGQLADIDGSYTSPDGEQFDGSDGHPNCECTEGLADAEAIVRAAGARDLGGPGSGDFGHYGRPGQVGGSAKVPWKSMEPSAKRAFKDRIKEAQTAKERNKIRQEAIEHAIAHPRTSPRKHGNQPEETKPVLKAELIKTDSGIEKKLQEMEIVKVKELGGGKHESWLVTFEDGTRGAFKSQQGDSERPGFKKGEGMLRETAAWEVAKLAGVEDLVQPTTIRMADVGNGPEPGSIQLFLEDGENAAKFPRNEQFDGETNALRVAMFDYLMANQDRHGNNWMFKEEDIHLIDHGKILGDTPWNAEKRRSDRFVQFAGLKHGDQSPQDYVKRYSAKKESISAALKRIGLSKEAIILWEKRLAKASKAQTWKDLMEDHSR